MNAVVRIGGNGTAPGRSLWLWCPGCEDVHRVSIDCPDGWTWDGNEQEPTIEPSIKVTGETICHSFVRFGQWQFLGDCTHHLAGQFAPVAPLPDWLTDEYVGGVTE